jgi:hypothetical protein
MLFAHNCKLAVVNGPNPLRILRLLKAREVSRTPDTLAFVIVILLGIPSVTTGLLLSLKSIEIKR